MKAKITVIVMLIISIGLLHLFVAMRPALDPAPPRLTFRETCRLEPRPDWCREFYEDLEEGRR